MHRRILALLYTWLRPEEFFHVYEELLHRPYQSSNIKAMLIHNYYKALLTIGQYQEVIDKLEKLSESPGSSRARVKWNNDVILCEAYLGLKDLQSAENILNHLSLQKKCSKSMKSDLTMLQIMLHIERGSVSSDEIFYLKELLKTPHSKLYELQITFFIACASALNGEEQTCSELLQLIVNTKASDCLIVMKYAKEALTNI